MSFFSLTPLLKTLFYWLLTSSITIRKPKALWFLILYCCSFAKSCPTLCDPMDCSTSGFPVLHYAQSSLKLKSVESVMRSNHLILCCPSPPTFNLSQHQGLFQWVSSSHQVLKYWSFSFSISPSNEIQEWFPLGWTSWISFLSKGLSRVFSNTTVQKHQFFSAQLSL